MKLLKELKNGIEILASGFQVRDQNSQSVGFGSITQEPLRLP